MRLQPKTFHILFLAIVLFASLDIHNVTALPRRLDPSVIDTLIDRAGRDREFELLHGTPASPKGDRSTRNAVKSRQKWHRIKTYDYKGALQRAKTSAGKCVGACLKAMVMDHEAAHNPDRYHLLSDGL